MALDDGKQEPESQLEGRKFSFEYEFPSDQRVKFTNHVTVQHTNEGEFIISFFEIFHPVVHGDSTQVQGQLEKLGDTIPANCIGRFVVSAARMPNLIGALINNYERYEKDTGKSAIVEADNQENQKHAS